MQIMIEIKPSDVADKIFGYVQSYLNSVDVLQNILDTRATYGVINETGKFAFPDTYEKFMLVYFIAVTENDIRVY